MSEKNELTDLRDFQQKQDLLSILERICARLTDINETLKDVVGKLDELFEKG